MRRLGFSERARRARSPSSRRYQQERCAAEMTTKAKSFPRRRITVPDGAVGLDAFATVARITPTIEVALCSPSIAGVKYAWELIFGDRRHLDESRIQRVTLCERDLALTAVKKTEVELK